MSITQSLFASNYPFTPNSIVIPGAELSVNNIQPGLLRKVYTGYFADNVSWFDTASLVSAGQDTSINLNAFSSVYSVQWTGYLFAPYNGTYVFESNSDDASYVWLGNNAKSGYTTSNSSINNGGAHGITSAYSAPIIMTAGEFYPIRIQYGDGGGNDGFNLNVNINNNGNVAVSGAWVWINGLTSEGFN